MIKVPMKRSGPVSNGDTFSSYLPLVVCTRLLRRFKSDTVSENALTANAFHVATPASRSVSVPVKAMAESIKSDATAFVSLHIPKNRSRELSGDFSDGLDRRQSLPANG